MTPFGIAGIQMNLHHGNNVDAIEERIGVLMSLYPWVEMVLLSELAAHGPLHNYAEPMPGITEERFCAMALKYNIWLVPGSIFELRDNAVFNTAPVINPQGEVIARHRKLFPFTPFEEGVEAGDEFVVFDVPGAGRFGLCICYDMWFPEVLRTLTSMGAEVILHPVLTGTNDREIELNLARSSGALFQSYIIDINGLGVGGVGKSCIIDPSGRVVHQSGESGEFIVTELDFDLVRRQREVGLRNLGQPLKSFRDSKIKFTVYGQEHKESGYLASLGPLAKTTRANKAVKAVEPNLLLSPFGLNTPFEAPLYVDVANSAAPLNQQVSLDAPAVELSFDNASDSTLGGETGALAESIVENGNYADVISDITLTTEDLSSSNSAHLESPAENINECYISEENIPEESAPGASEVIAGQTSDKKNIGWMKKASTLLKSNIKPNVK